LYKQVELDKTIPAGLYKAVAKVLAYIYQQKRQRA
jgi:flagellar biosynthesis protein FlhB